MEVLTEQIKRYVDYWEVCIKEQPVMKRRRIQREIATEQYMQLMKEN